MQILCASFINHLAKLHYYLLLLLPLSPSNKIKMNFSNRQMRNINY